MPSHRLLTAAVAALATIAAPVAAATPAAASDPGLTFSVRGTGFGHGAGMAQYGAQGLATPVEDGGRGWSTEQILTHYYSGASLETRSEPRITVHLYDDPGGTVSFTAPAAFEVRRADDGGGARIVPANTQLDVGWIGGTYVFRIGGPGGTTHAAPGGVVMLHDPTLYPGIGLVPITVHATNRAYQWGRLTMTPRGGGSRLVVADVRMRNYLNGIDEMPASWQPAALGAQAVAARTYALNKVSNGLRSACDCHVYDSVQDQYYRGDRNKAARDGDWFSNWTSAVAATTGRALVADGSLISALYHSSSGGHTADSEDAFVSELSYLRGVKDPGSGVQPGEPVTWTAQISAAALEAKYPSVGTVTSIEVAGVGTGNWITSPAQGGGITITGTAGSTTVSGPSFRFAFGLKSARFSPGFDAADGPRPGGTFVAAANTPAGGRVVLSDPIRFESEVRVTDLTGTVVSTFSPYGEFAGGVRVAACDAVADNPGDEIITAPGRGGGPHIKVFTTDGTLLDEFFAYDPGYKGGVWVGCGDIVGTPLAEIVTGPGKHHSPRVRVWSASGQLQRQFMAYVKAFKGGVRVATAGLGGTKDFIVTGPGPGGGPHLRILRADGAVMDEYMAFDRSVKFGLFVGAGNLTGDDLEEVVVGNGGGSVGDQRLRIFDAVGALADERTPFSPLAGVGVRVATLDDRLVLSTGGRGWPLAMVTR